MKLNIKQLAGPEGSLEVEQDATILSLKERLEVKWKIPAVKQRLVFKGRTLEDDKTLRQCSIEDGNKLFVSVKKEASAPTPVPAALPSDTQYADPAQPPAPISSALNSAANLLSRLVGSAQQAPETRAPAPRDFWEVLYEVLKKHYSEQDALTLLQQYRSDYKQSLSRLSLDQIERIATAGLQREGSMATQAR